ncbi:MAG: tRNA (guanosine(46)-N7)-methyltransferase TrmB [Verrucomicrobiota bacterium]
MRGKSTLSPDEARHEVILEPSAGPPSFGEIFAREASTEVDLGCGEGTFLARVAAQFPERNFLGVENLRGRVRSSCRKMARAELGNARMVRCDILDALIHLIPPGSVSAFYLLFPDPWPKRRHHRRRTFTASFLRLIHGALRADGLCHVATDDVGYFREMKGVLSAQPIFSVMPDALALPPTAFEQKFATREIYRLSLRKVSPVR